MKGSISPGRPLRELLRQWLLLLAQILWLLAELIGKTQPFP